MSDKKISQLTAATTPLAGTEVLPIVQSGATVKVPVASMFGANVYTFLNTPNSANLAAAVTDETGTGALVFATNPTFINSGSANPSATFTNTAFQDTRVDYYMANNGNKITLQFASDNGATLTNDITSYGSAAGGVPNLNNAIEMGNANGKVRVTTDGNVLATTGNLVIGTAGKGIDFSADGQAAGMTSELLDDYEEGTFTPTYGGSTSDPTITYATQNGRYVKVGSLVQATVEISTNAVSGGSGNLVLNGLPFAAFADRYVGGSFVGYAEGFTTRCPRSGYLGVGASSVTLTSDASATTQVPISTSNLTDGASQNYLIMTVVYRAA